MTKLPPDGKNSRNGQEVDLTPHRKDGESYEDYKERRKKGNEYLKWKKKGMMFWNSKQRGTYTVALGNEMIKNV